MGKAKSKKDGRVEPNGKGGKGGKGSKPSSSKKSDATTMLPTKIILSENDYEKDIFIKSLGTTTMVDFFSNDKESFDKLINTIVSTSLTEGKRIVIINTNTSTFNAKTLDKLIPILCTTSNDIYVSTQEDKRSKLLKIVIEANIIRFNKPNEKDYTKFVHKIIKKEKLDIDDKAIGWLIKYTNLDYYLVSNYVIQLGIYKPNEKVTLADVESLLVQNEQVLVYELMDAIINRDSKLVYKLCFRVDAMTLIISLGKILVSISSKGNPQGSWIEKHNAERYHKVKKRLPMLIDQTLLAERDIKVGVDSRLVVLKLMQRAI